MSEITELLKQIKNLHIQTKDLVESMTHALEYNFQPPQFYLMAIFDYQKFN
ncbi:hypothetical protein OAI97_03965 [Nitrosopumilus sp.]|nr:hypothetical protein [Nitrosopumilus sp.]